MKKKIIALLTIFLLTSCCNFNDDKINEVVTKQTEFENNLKCNNSFFKLREGNVKEVKYSRKNNSCIVLATNNYGKDYFIKNMFNGEQIFSCEEKNDAGFIKCSKNVYDKFKNLE